MAAPIVAPLASALASGMGRLVASAGTTAARTGSLAATGSRSASAAGNGVSITSKSLDKFVHQQSRMNNINNRMNRDNNKYLRNFELTMNRTEKVMRRMNLYSLSMGNVFRTIGNGLAGIGLYSLIKNGDKSNISRDFESKVSKMSTVDTKILSQLKNKYKLPLDEFMLNFGKVARTALSDPGSNEGTWFTKTKLSPTEVLNADGKRRLEIMVDAIKRARGSVYDKQNLSEILGLDAATLDHLAKTNWKPIFSDYGELQTQITFENEQKLIDLEKSRIDRENELNNALDRFRGTFSGFTDWFEGMWNDLKISFLDNFTKIFKSLFEWWDAFAKWWNNSPTRSSIFRLPTFDYRSPEENRKHQEMRKLQDQVSDVRQQSIISVRSRINIARQNREFASVLKDAYNIDPYTDISSDIENFSDLINNAEDKDEVGATYTKVNSLIEDLLKNPKFELAALYGKGEDEDASELEREIKKNVVKALIPAIGYSDLNEAVRLKALEDLDRGANYKDVVVKVYTNGYDINSQPATTVREKR